MHTAFTIVHPVRAMDSERMTLLARLRPGTTIGISARN